MDRVIFVDIDDVLLSARALVLRGNRQFLREQGLAVNSRLAAFDPIGIEMLNRIAELADARFVLSTSWRYSVGPSATIDALKRNGLSAAKFHPNPSCELRGTYADGAAGKARDIAAWLDYHAEVEAWVTLDNDPSLSVYLEKEVQGFRGLVIEVDPLVGISARNYSEALQHLGAAGDTDLTVFKAFRLML